MYRINDHIVYGKTGICKITDITVPKHVCNTDRLYYVLEPLNENCLIYTPVDTKMFMRPVISAEEAERLIDRIPNMQAEAYYNNRLQELMQHYESFINTFDCADLLELAISIHLKKQTVIQQNQKLGQTDEKYRKQVEERIASEFSVALGIPKGDVLGYIESRINAKNKKAGS